MPKLTYANVMSTLGVFLALGGTSYAVARNSVGTPQLKNSSVTSGKIRNGTVARTDLAPAARGGSRGPRGAQGVQGVSGARGPSGGYVDGGPPVGLPGAANALVTVARIETLPAGSYILSSQAQIGDFNNNQQLVTCEIRTNGENVALAHAVIGSGVGSTRVGVVSSIAAVTRNAPFSATLECRSDISSATPPGVENQHLSAIRVETLAAT